MQVVAGRLLNMASQLQIYRQARMKAEAKPPCPQEQKLAAHMK